MPVNMNGNGPLGHRQQAPATNGNKSSSDEEESADSFTRPMPARKMSSPLAPAFMVSAPGKVIVYGEHAVVHGKVE